MKADYVNFDYNATGGPNVTNNSLPNHSRPKINALTEDSIRLLKTKISDVKTAMENVYKVLIQAKVLYQKKQR